jgi:precorrin-8X/cobalt-precorrin-8 methylmutase
VSLVSRYALAPDQIEAQSLARVDAHLRATAPFAGEALEVARRMVYAAGDLSLGERVRISPGAAATAIAALRGGSRIVLDVRMVESALDRRLADQLGCGISCAIDLAGVVAEAARSGLPRAVVAMRLLRADLDGAVVAIGTAPTALLAVLDMVDAGEVCPAVIVGTPVGLLIAPEAKAELMARAVPYVSVEGTRGGAAMAAAATNALLRLAASRGQGPAGGQPIEACG